ncbi:MAG: type VI secretion system baseplate subunit TssK [Acidobacteriaceae bacterium]|nr:type VI secretion system baseplate subunit TssK [Acidobacteriaceae bacterium]MBV8572661.1 type VI secretion system baseplate subunit TssK [Acidobacteriaceae bacterium]
MKRLEPVIWSKGTFLTPQHLQIQDRFLENTLQFQLEALSFRPWGFREWRVDQQALSTGTFALSAASGIFPDGLLFDIPDSDAGPPPRSIVDCFDVDSDSLDIYLTIPPYREKGLNVSGSEWNGDTRYRADFVLMRDENTGLAEKPVQIGRKNFRFLTGQELREGSSALRAARVQRTATGTFHLDPLFVPPVLDFAASPYLVSVARRLVEILAAKSGQLAGLRREKNQGLADFTSADIASFWLLYTINSHFPLIHHLFAANTGHPERLFTAMLTLAGALTTFSTTIQPRHLPAYDHDNLSFSFSDLDEKLRILLETVVPSNFVSLPMKLVKNSIYAAAVNDDKYLKNTRLYLAVSAEMSQAELITRTPQLIKVCSATHIEHLVRQALPGVPLAHVSVPPSSIPVKLNYQYFSVGQGGLAWEAIARSRNVAAYVPGDFPNPQLELIVLLPQAQ